MDLSLSADWVKCQQDKVEQAEDASRHKKLHGKSSGFNGLEPRSNADRYSRYHHDREYGPYNFAKPEIVVEVGKRAAVL